VTPYGVPRARGDGTAGRACHPSERVVCADVKRILSATAAVALGLGVLTACGGGDDAAASGYCDDLKATKTNLDAIQEGDLSSLEKAADQIHDLRDEAPEAVSSDWKVLSDGFDKILAAFQKAGLDADDIAKLQDGTMPEGVDMQALQDAMTEIQDLSSDDFTKAGDAISKHAKDECNVDLQA
jgi:hypothetical protein